MKILHITTHCHLQSVGGTERYILDLIQELDGLRHESAIGWLTVKKDGVGSEDPVTVFALPGTKMRIDRASADLLPAFKQLVDRFQPDIVHFHTFGRSEAAIARSAFSLGIPYTFTYHSPGWTCRRGDLMAFDGNEPCDGQVKTLRCSACKLHQRSSRLPVWASWLLAMASAPMSLMLAGVRQTHFRRRTAFLVDTSALRKDLRFFLKNCDLIFACAEWSVPVLIKNEAAIDKIQVCPQGVSGAMILPDEGRHSIAPASHETFNIGYVGRIVSVKGIDILIAGFRMLESENARLSIYGWPSIVPKSSFFESILQAAEEDSRIKLVPRLSMAEMIEQYQELDLLCIPSVWPETGPLVLFEALQRGIPVYGTSRIGQLNLLKSRGMVVDPNEPGQWHQALDNAYQKFTSGKWVESTERAFGSGELRSMTDVAGEVNQGYLTLRS